MRSALAPLLLAATLPGGCSWFDGGSDPALVQRVTVLENRVEMMRLQAAARDGAGSGATTPPPAPLPAPAAPAPAALAVPAPPPGPDPLAEAEGPPRFAIHLASYRRPGDVARGWRELAGGHADLLNGLQPRVAAVNFGARGGSYYRLKAGPFESRAQAVATCRKARAAGLFCAVEDFAGTPGEAFWSGL